MNYQLAPKVKKNALVDVGWGLTCQRQSLVILRMVKQITKNPAAVALGSLGGSAGRGESKRRSKAHYKRLSALGVLARQKKVEIKH